MSPIAPRCARPERSSSPARSARSGSRLVSIAVAALASIVAAGVPAQQNLSFEELDERAAPLGWSAAGNAEIAVAQGTAVDGEHSLQVTRTAPAGATRVTQRIPAAAVRGDNDSARVQRVRLIGFARTTIAAPAFWLRIDGARGPLFLDSYGFGRELAEREPAPAATGGGWQRYEIELPLPPDVTEIAFGVSLRGEGTAWFDALELTAVTTDSWLPAAPAAVSYVEAALEVMREHSLRRAEVDWPTLRTRALEHARGATSPAEAQLAVRFALRELGDRHSYLQSAAVTRALQTTAVSNARTGAAPTAPQSRRLEGNLAYVQVPGFAGGTPLQQVEFAEALKNIVQFHDEAGVCGWVVDLRQNTGGNLWPMLAGLGPLLGEGEVAASVYPDGRRVAVWYRDGQAGFGDYTQLRVRSAYRLRAAKPVAVLTGPSTASSAEVVAVAFRGRPGTRSFGAPTRGLSAGNRTFALADEASLVLTVAATSDPTGRIFAEALVPDEPVGPADPSGGSEPSRGDALAAAAAWLTGGDSCR